MTSTKNDFYGIYTNTNIIYEELKINCIYYI